MKRTSSNNPIVSGRNRVLGSVLSVALLSAPVFFLSSCQNKLQDSPFGGVSSSERISGEVKRVRDLLVAQKDGWVLKNIPGPNRNYGGYNVIIKFLADGTAYAAGELQANPDGTFEWEKGTYEIRNDQGVVISFPTYLRPITWFADSDLGFGGGTGKGYEGDFGFIIKNASDDRRVLLEGRNSGNIMELFVPSGQTPEEYFKKVMAYRKSASNSDALFKAKGDGWIANIDGKEVLLTYSPGYSRFVVSDPNNPDIQESFLSYIFTPDNVELVCPYSSDPSADESKVISESVLAPFSGIKNLKYDGARSVWTTDTGVEFVPHEDPIWDEYAKFLGGYLVQMPSASLFRLEPFTFVPGPGHTYIAKPTPRQDGTVTFGYELVFNYVTHRDIAPETGKVAKEYKTIRLSGQNIIYKGQSYELAVVSKAGRLWREPEYGLDAVPVDNSIIPGWDAFLLQDNGATGSDPLLALIALKGMSIAENVDPVALIPGSIYLSRAPVTPQK